MARVTARPRTPEPGAARSGRHGRRRHNSVTALVILAPLVIVGTFYAAPTLLSFPYAFTDWNTGSSAVHFTGLENFRFLINTTGFTDSLVITAKYMVGLVALTTVVALLLALGLERTTRLHRILLSVFFLPVVLPGLAAGYIFRAILDPNGFFNRALGFVLQRHVSFPWLGSLRYTLFVLILITMWKFLGVAIVVYLTALVSIPSELLEAAQVEGAGAWTIFRRVKLPLVGPATTYNVVLLIIGGLWSFEIPLVVTGGGPAGVTNVLNLLLFQTFGTGSLGFATAISLSLTMFTLILVVPLVVYLRRREVQV